MLARRAWRATAGWLAVGAVVVATSAADVVVGGEVADADTRPAAAADEAFPLREFLVLPAVGTYGRAPLHRDAVEAQLVTGQWQRPGEGDQVRSPTGRIVKWQRAEVGDDSTLDTRSFRRGYAVATFESPTERVMLLDAAGHATAYVNGEPRAGDPYSLGWLRLPVLIREGTNEFLFHAGTTRLAARLVAPASEIYLDDADATLPTIAAGRPQPAWAAMPIVNASRDVLSGGYLVCRQLPDGPPLEASLPAIGSLAVYKAPFQIPSPDVDAETFQYELKLIRRKPSDNAQQTSDESPEGSTADEVLAVATFDVRAETESDIHVRTFRSSVDGSVQRYAVRAARPQGDPADETTAPALILALHGAAVPCERMARQYTAKDWAHVVAPMGRRPYGFDWEDWGRIDALEALADAQRHYPCDPQRFYLTGHSMGGHGTWHLGVLYPGRFAAIGPSAGWASFWSYGGGMPLFENPTAIQSMLLRGYSPSDTLQLLENLRNNGVYILHGAADQNVPAQQARFMRSRLANFHPNFVYYEEPRAGHWWGSASCDWPRMMDFFRRHTIKPIAEMDEIDFVTPNPGVAHGVGWISVEAQHEQLRPSRVTAQQDVERRTFRVKTENVARLALSLGHLEPSRPLRVEIDGQPMPRVDWPGADLRVWFEQRGETWEPSPPPLARWKGPHRYGTFKSAFDRDVLLIYGTCGSKEENDWARAKARYDAETFWYRGNGAIEVIADTAFDPYQQPHRNVILYGNADTNAAWPALLSTSPVQVRRDRVTVGIRPEAGDDLAVLLVRPRPGSDRAVVGVVSGTGVVGMRLTNRLRYFVSGVAYPDLLVFGPRALTEGTADIRALGYFGLDWKVDSGEIMWRDLAL